MQLVQELETADWVQSIAIADVDNDLKLELVLGLVNNTVQSYKLQLS
jgi:hypothetical protein